jgi:RimJ/RimL family protein N-acetyltransferase
MHERSSQRLVTPRLRLVPATPELIIAELDSHVRLGEAIGVAIPADWPPEHHDHDTLRFWLDALSERAASGWWLHYVVLTECATPKLVGTAGYKGPPVDGVVEIGYSVVPSWQRRGLATEASRALIETAWERGAETVVAHTLPHLDPSIAVLRRLGFRPSESPEPGVLGFTLRRADYAPGGPGSDRAGTS